MPLRDWSFEVGPPQADGAGWWFEVRGATLRRHGPYPTAQAAGVAQHGLFQRWRRAARARGGWAWKASAARWVVTLPPEHAVDGVPLRSEACTRHLPEADQSEKTGSLSSTPSVLRSLGSSPSSVTS